MDVLDFLSAFEEGEFEVAAGLYLGPLLDGIHLKDAPEFERWTDKERDRISRAYGESLEKLARSAESNGDWRAQRPTQREPCGRLRTLSRRTRKY